MVILIFHLQLVAMSWLLSPFYVSWDPFLCSTPLAPVLEQSFPSSSFHYCHGFLTPYLSALPGAPPSPSPAPSGSAPNSIIVPRACAPPASPGRYTFDHSLLSSGRKGLFMCYSFGLAHLTPFCSKLLLGLLILAVFNLGSSLLPPNPGPRLGWLRSLCYYPHSAMDLSFAVHIRAVIFCLLP